MLNCNDTPRFLSYWKKNLSSDLIGMDLTISDLQLGHLTLFIRRRYDAHQKHELQRTKYRSLLLSLPLSLKYDSIDACDTVVVVAVVNILSFSFAPTISVTLGFGSSDRTLEPLQDPFP
jgi:hypothetical protein